MQDMIYRQVAIDAFKKELTTGEPKGNYITICSAVSFEGAKQILEALPAVQSQPEIIRCCKCVYWQQNTVRQNSNDERWWNEALCEKHTIYGNEPHEAWVDADWYCADAERRTDEL